MRTTRWLEFASSLAAATVAGFQLYHIALSHRLRSGMLRSHR
jgi:hypothetical protein